MRVRGGRRGEKLQWEEEKLRRDYEMKDKL